MADIREIRKEMKKKKRNRNIRRIAVVVILLSLVVTVFLSYDKLSPEALSQWLEGSIMTEGEDEGFPISLPSGETLSLLSVKSNIALTNQTNVIFYSARGKKLRSVQHSRKNVQSKAKGDNLLVYSVGGDSVSVETASKTVASVKTEKPTITGDISKSGRFVIATESDVYTSELKVFDKNANAIFKWAPSVGVITAVAISSDGGYVAAATASTQGGKLLSGVYLFKTTKEDAIISKQISDELVISLFCENDFVKAVCSEKMIFISDGGQEVKEFSYDQKKIVNYTPCSEGTAIVFRDVNDPSLSVLQIVSDKGELKSSATISEEILDISSGGSEIYLVSETTAYKYKASTATLIDKATLEDEGQKICSSSAAAYVITSAHELVKPKLS